MSDRKSLRSGDIHEHERPDLTPLAKASETVGKLLSQAGIVVYESTVYFGATEEVYVPILEAHSGLTYDRGIYCGDSPERINPGDKEHRVVNIKKVISGSTPEVAEFVDALYRRVIVAGTHKASSIRVADAAKVIENTQRDVNIALINELAFLFHKLGLNTWEVLEAAGSKWNFLPFRLGLVGEHCVGVDPYYLTHKAQEIGRAPEMILAGRRTNDGMGEYVVQCVIKLMNQRRIHVGLSRVLILGLIFKGNGPDIRNTRIIDIAKELQGYNVKVDAYDPWADAEETRHECGIGLTELQQGRYHAIIVAVALITASSEGWAPNVFGASGKPEVCVPGAGCGRGPHPFPSRFQSYTEKAGNDRRKACSESSTKWIESVANRLVVMLREH